MGQDFELARDRFADVRMVVAMRDRPPRSHAVDEFASVGELEARALGAQRLLFGLRLPVHRDLLVLGRERRPAGDQELGAEEAHAFRAVPGIGEGYTWFQIKVLGFSETFFGVLGSIGAAVGVVSLWLLSDTVFFRSAEGVCVCARVLNLPPR